MKTRNISLQACKRSVSVQGQQALELTSSVTEHSARARRRPSLARAAASVWQRPPQRPGRGRPGRSCCPDCLLRCGALLPSQLPAPEGECRAGATDAQRKSARASPCGYQFSKAPRDLSPSSDLRCESSCLIRLRGRQAVFEAVVALICPATRGVPHACPGGELVTELAGWAGHLSSLPPLSALAVHGVHTFSCFCVCVLLSVVCHLDMLMWLHRRGTQRLWRAWDTSENK